MNARVAGPENRVCKTHLVREPELVEHAPETVRGHMTTVTGPVRPVELETELAQVVVGIKKGTVDVNEIAGNVAGYYQARR